MPFRVDTSSLVLGTKMKNPTDFRVRCKTTSTETSIPQPSHRYKLYSNSKQVLCQNSIKITKWQKLLLNQNVTAAVLMPAFPLSFFMLLPPPHTICLPRSGAAVPALVPCLCSSSPLSSAALLCLLSEAPKWVNTGLYSEKG